MSGSVLMESSLRHKSFFALMAALLVAAFAYSFLQWTEAIGRGWTGIYWNTSFGTSVVLTADRVLPLSPADRAGVRKDDVLVAANGISISDLARVETVLAAARPGEVVTLRLRRNQQEWDTRFALMAPLSHPSVAAGVLIRLLSAIVFFSLAAFVYLRRAPDTRVPIFFGLSSAFALLMVLSAGPTFTYTLFKLGNLLVILASIVIALHLFPALAHFCLLFPRRRPVLDRRPRLTRWIYGPPLLITVVLVAAFVLAARLYGAAIRVGSDELTGSLRPFLDWLAAHEAVRAVLTGVFVAFVIALAAALLLIWVVLPVAAGVALYRSYREAGVEERQQVRWPLMGIILTIATYFLAGVVLAFATWALGIPERTVTYAVIRFLRDNLLYIVVIAIPISFAFAILKYRLLEIDLYIRKTVIYGGVTGLLGALFLVLAGGLGGLISTITGLRSEWMAAASTLLVAAAAAPVRNRVQAVVDRRFFRRSRNDTAELELLARAVSDAPNRRALLAGAVDRLQQALETRFVAALARPASERSYLVEAKVGLSDEAAGALRIPDTGPIVEMETAGPPPGEAAGAALAVPIRRRGELLALMLLGTKLSDEEYAEGDLSFLAAAAGQIGTGLENLKLADQEKEFQKAREIQQALLPRDIPRVPGMEISAIWEPARAIGGDYYDVLDLGGGKIALVIADVAGKGLTAALLMSNLQAAVKAFAPESAGAAELCARVNRMVAGNVVAGKFITFFYAVVDTSRRTMCYANCGHNPPLLRRAGGEILRLEAGGPVLGVLKAAPFAEATVDLQSGDRMLLFTDGVSEAFGAGEEDFGEDRLIALLGGSEYARAAELRDAVLSAVTDFCAGNFHDDVTLIAVTVGAPSRDAEPRP